MRLLAAIVSLTTGVDVVGAYRIGRDVPVMTSPKGQCNRRAALQSSILALGTSRLVTLQHPTPRTLLKKLILLDFFEVLLRVHFFSRFHPLA